MHHENDSQERAKILEAAIHAAAGHLKASTHVAAGHLKASTHRAAGLSKARTRIATGHLNLFYVHKQAI
jgi:hypothetical protein